MTIGPPGPDRVFEPVPPDELRARSAQSGVARLIGQGAQLALMVGAGMALARLLTPEDFGILAMVTVVTGAAESVRHFGLPQAAVQADDLSHEVATDVFWRGLRLSGLVMLAMAASAPLVAGLYREPRVTWVLVILSVGFGIRSLTAMHEALLMRRLRFGVLAIVEAGAWAVAVTVGIGLALLGAGYVALVVQALVLDVTRSLGVRWAMPWRPGGVASFRRGMEAAALFTYGWDVTRYKLLAYIGRNVDRLVVGLAQGAAPLGYYDAAYRWSRYPMDQVAGPLASVALASLARVRHDPESYRRACTVGLLPVVTVIIGALAFFAVEAERTIFVLLGDQWAPAVPIFRILCVCGVGATVIRMAKWLFLVEGNTASQLRWGLAYFPVTALCSVAGLRWGSVGVAVGYTVGTWAMAPAAVSTALRGSELRTRDLYAIFVRPAFAAVLAAGATVALERWLQGAVHGVSGAVVLTRQAILFVAVFSATWLLLPGGRERLRDMVDLLKLARPGSCRGSGS